MAQHWAKRRKYNGNEPSTDDTRVKDLCSGPKKGSSSLTEAIFGGASRQESSAFASSAAGAFDSAVQQRIQANVEKHNEKRERNKNTLRTDEDEPKSAPALLSVDNILTRRRRQSSCSFVEQLVTAVAPDSSEQDIEDSTERAVPKEERVEEIARIVQTHGFAVVRNVLSKTVLDELSKCAKQIEEQVCQRLDEKSIQWGCNSATNPPETFRFYEVASRCAGRMDVRYRTDEEPFSASCVVENPSLMPIVNALLGGDASTDPSHLPKLLYAGLILSFPGSDDQPWHQDGMPLFPELSPSDVVLPPYAINVFLPLSDQDGSIEAGPTEFIPGSHAMEEHVVVEAAESVGRQAGEAEKDDEPAIVSPVLKQGDALLYDYRVCHRGTSNLTGRIKEMNGGGPRVRRILYFMYARPWFKEHLNFGSDRLFPL